MQRRSQNISREQQKWCFDERGDGDNNYGGGHERRWSLESRNFESKNCTAAVFVLCDVTESIRFDGAENKRTLEMCPETFKDLSS